jgi:hypothetical protein
MRNFEEIMTWAENEFEGEPEKIRKLALDSYKSERCFEMNKEMLELQKEAGRRGLKHHTFAWILNNARMFEKMKVKYGLIVKWEWKMIIPKKENLFVLIAYIIIYFEKYILRKKYL